MTRANATHKPRIVIVGAGAAGALSALHLTREAGRRSTAVEIVLLDPADRWARGTAFGTADDQHLLNVPASGMSALPEDPTHFVAWRRRNGGSPDGYVFAPRREWARYLDETLSEAVRQAGGEVTVEHRRTRAVGVRRHTCGAAVTTSDGEEIACQAVIVATGLPAAGHHWAPPELADSPFFVPDPWAPGAIDVVRRDRTGPADVLLVGAGLTMVDLTLSLTGEDARTDRVLHALSRSGRLPHPHAPALKPAAIPDVSDWGADLASIRERTHEHLHRVWESAGDWRPAVDGLRFQLATLWGRLTEEDRAAFLATDAGEWNVVRHRMAPSSDVVIRELTHVGRLDQLVGEVRSAEPLPRGGLRVTLSDDRTLDVGWVVNCTGPRLDIRTLGNPLLDDLLRDRKGGALATLATAGMGVRTDHGRLVDEVGSTAAPLWTLGALRKGELWESTAVPEIRTQALALATGVLDAVAPLPRRLADGTVVPGTHPAARPRDPLGLPLSTTAEAAAAYNAGLERVMRLQSGGEDLIREATRLDPDFAIAHAALAMLGHEAGASADVQASLRAAQRAARRRGDDRERSFVEMVAQRVRDARHEGAIALRRHVAEHPRDVLAVSAAVPTIAFSGLIDVQQEAWDLVEGLAPAYGDHWWYISLLAFIRQDQGRYEEAGLLAESALSCEPSSGHAVHALTHVFYETGQHETGREWLDHWVAASGRSASHRAHFSWHAALHELALGDTEAVRARYYSQLAPPAVTGVRALVDSASLLWRWRITISSWDPAETDPPPIEPVLAAVGEELLDRPGTPFIALHAALAIAATGDRARLVALGEWCRSAAESPTREVVAPIVDALVAAADDRWADAAEILSGVIPALVTVGGSAAQREVIEESLLLCEQRAGLVAEARTLLEARLERRSCKLDADRAELLTR
ncbi:FAD/NAD(P)-binding protein [Nocardioides nematodiphilus]|uniref:FAD/NAD(P)-binding protein n=1 Tax=Nocardioides nematodiphilus TaxID=2849669 RepID=UPI001CD9A93A|nr:FAD/NAD(P)-binding protein [Nocardioides nematodiphilus]MCA1984105.1 FAD/NAD(P)-binding protein [Nocardioides nematodiphilus]